MSSSPITIVIPVYNRAHTLPRLLRSIDAQTLAPAAVVLVDNNSTDCSMSVMEEWAAAHENVTVLSQPRRGAPAARNLGLGKVRTEWTMFFDSDDEMLPRHIEDFTRAIETSPKADIIGKDVILRDSNGSGRRLRYTTHNPLFNHIFRSILSTQRHIARTELYRKAGGWDETLPAWDDFELGVRLLLEKPHMATAPGPPTAIAYFQEESLTGTDFSSAPDKWEKSLSAIRNTLGKRQTDRNALQWLDARCLILAAIYSREGASGHAERLRSAVASRTRHPRRMNLIYGFHRLVGRFTWILVRLLFPG